jgi:hypothetical protein
MLEEAEFYRRTPCRALCPTHHVWDGPREAGKQVESRESKWGSDFGQWLTAGLLGKGGGYNKVTVGGYHNIQLAHEAQEHGDGPQSPWTKATALLGPHH